MAARYNYVFGDSALASERLGWLALAYEPALRELVGRFGVARPSHVIDLGSGPGHTTRLLHRLLESERTTGIDAAGPFVAEAKANAPPGVSFVQHDVLEPPFPVEPAELIYCRHLLAHIAERRAAFSAWVELARPGARLLVQETETLESDDAALARYYECVVLLLSRRGRHMNVGGTLEAALAGTPWTIEHSSVNELEMDPRLMAKLHVMNLRTWRTDDIARELFDPAEIDELDRRLSAIENGTKTGVVVRNTLRELVVRL
jgi:SAM-dependent methyltransferase